MVSNLYENIPNHLPNEQVKDLLKRSDVKIERIVSRGHRSPEDFWYDQQWDEWILLVKGAAGLAFDDAAPIELKPGDHLMIPAHKRHRVAWTADDEDTIWLAVHISQ